MLTDWPKNVQTDPKSLGKDDGGMMAVQLDLLRISYLSTGLFHVQKFSKEACDELAITLLSHAGAGSSRSMK